MNIKDFLDHLNSGRVRSAIIHGKVTTSYASLYEKILDDRHKLKSMRVSNAAVLFVANFSANNISMLFALWLEGNTVALSSSRQTDRNRDLAQSTGAKFIVSVADEWGPYIKVHEADAMPPNVAGLIDRGEAGFVVFSSGTTGPAKGVVHRLSPFLERYGDNSTCGTMLAFMSFDHIGGIGTLFQVLATYGTLVIPEVRSPAEVGRCVEQHRINTLHVSPTLLNLALISGAFEGRNTDSLEQIYYGSEPISSLVLERVRKYFPQVKLTQLYGMSETGILPCQNKPDDSRWLKVDVSGFSVKVVGGICHIQSKTTMLGYLTDTTLLPEGMFFNTGDLAETDGQYFRINGRKAHLINVGGTNVNPTDVERVLEACENVSDVVVSGESNLILGEVVAARIVLEKPERLEDLKARLYKLIKGALTPEQIPRLITISNEPLYTERFKKVR